MDNATSLPTSEPVNQPAAARVARRRGVRWQPFVATGFFVLALVQIAVNGPLDWSWVPSTLAAAGAFVFAGALLWAAPADRPLLTYGAFAIAASAALGLIATSLSQEMLASTPLLAGAPLWLSIGQALLLATGALLVALAFGVIHSNGGWTVFWLGAGLTVSGIGLVTIKSPTAGGRPIDVLVLAATQIVPLVWAYMCAVFMGVNRWFVRGAAMMLIFIAFSQLTQWLPLGPDTNYANLRFGLGVLEAISWALLIIGAVSLRSEPSL